jgi:integrase
MSFYPGVQLQYGWNALNDALQRGQVTEDDTAIIRHYIGEYQATRHIKEHRALKTLYDITNWRRFIKKPYRDCTAGDVYLGINDMKTGLSLRDKPFKQNTQHDYIKALKQFLLWMHENGYTSIPVDKIKAIKTPARDMDTTRPDELLSEQEILKMIEAARSTRDKAIISLFFELGCRIGELARLKWHDITFDRYGAKVHVTDTKTNKMRYSRITASVEFVSSWRNVSAFNTSDDPVFYSNRNEPMEYQNLSKMLKDTAKKAGITKPIKTHLFRKSRITSMVRQNYQESIIKQVAWGNPDTRMLRTYLCLAEKDIDNAFLEKAGIQTEESQQENVLKPRPCARCHTINSPTSQFCSKCAFALTSEVAADQDDLISKLLENPAILRRMAEEMERRIKEGG